MIIFIFSLEAGRTWSPSNDCHINTSTSTTATVDCVRLVNKNLAVMSVSIIKYRRIPKVASPHSRKVEPPESSPPPPETAFNCKNFKKKFIEGNARNLSSFWGLFIHVTSYFFQIISKCDCNYQNALPVHTISISTRILAKDFGSCSRISNAIERHRANDLFMHSSAFFSA